MLRKIILYCLAFSLTILTFAQEPQSVDKTMKEIVKKHEAAQGVSCIRVAKGEGLGVIKMMLNKEFGKDFMKGVTSITIIDYSDASEESCVSLRNDLDAFLTILQEFDISEEEEFADNDYIRCFASEAAAES